MKTFTRLNFHKHTYCEFDFVDFNLFKEKNTHFTSKSGSKYFYTTAGVYRYSNHWGRVANCRWTINGVENYKNQNYYLGFAKWSNFFPLNSNEKVFYLEITSEGKVQIFRNEENNPSHFLITLDFALKRQKEIQSLFKENKWMNYYKDDSNVIRKKMIKELITTTISLSKIKQNILFEISKKS